MATAAEPKPAELPLAGGRDGAKVRLHPLLTATVQGPPAWFLREEGRLAWRKAFGLGVPKDQWLKAPIQAFLLEHPVAGPVLVDTGFHGSVAVKPALEPRRVRDGHLPGHRHARRAGGGRAAARARASSRRA